MHLEKFQDGCYDVFAENGRRVGVVSGGAGIWSAEFEKKVCGYHSSKTKAAQAVLAAAGITEIYEQMCAIVKANPELLVGYSNDLHKTDKEIVGLWRCATDMVWVVRPYGTHLVLMDLPRSREELMAVYETYIREPYQKFECYFIDAATMKFKPIAFKQLPDFAAKKPKWNIEHSSAIYQDRIVAHLVEKDLRTGVYGEMPTGSITAQTLVKPTEKEQIILQKMVYEYAVIRSQSLFAKVNDVRIEHNGELLYSSRHERERAKKLADKAAAKSTKEAVHV